MSRKPRLTPLAPDADAARAEPQPVLTFAGVGLRYGRGEEVLREVSFALDAGSFHFLTGPSGAGKSSLLKLICRAERPSQGRVTLFGQDLACPAAAGSSAAACGRAASGWCSRTSI